MNYTGSVRKIVFTSLFSALIILGAYIKIPLGPVPITLSSFFILLAGLMLPIKWGLLSVTTYLLLGFMGLPVFSQGAGIAYILGPTGGFLIAYIPAVLLVALIAGRKPNSLIRLLLGLLAGSLVLYICGVPWLMLSLNLSLSRALAAGMLPFLPGDIIKIAAAAGLYRALVKIHPDLLVSMRFDERENT